MFWFRVEFVKVHSSSPFFVFCRRKFTRWVFCILENIFIISFVFFVGTLRVSRSFRFYAFFLNFIHNTPQIPMTMTIPSLTMLKRHAEASSPSYHQVFKQWQHKNLKSWHEYSYGIFYLKATTISKLGTDIPQSLNVCAKFTRFFYWSTMTGCTNRDELLTAQRDTMSRGLKLQALGEWCRCNLEPAITELMKWYPFEPVGAFSLQSTSAECSCSTASMVVLCST